MVGFSGFKRISGGDGVSAFLGRQKMSTPITELELIAAQKIFLEKSRKYFWWQKERYIYKGMCAAIRGLLNTNFNIDLGPIH